MRVVEWLQRGMKRAGWEPEGIYTPLNFLWLGNEAREKSAIKTSSENPGKQQLENELSTGERKIYAE